MRKALMSRLRSHSKVGAKKETSKDEAKEEKLENMNIKHEEEKENVTVTDSGKESLLLEKDRSDEKQHEDVNVATNSKPNSACEKNNNNNNKAAELNRKQEPALEEKENDHQQNLHESSELVFDQDVLEETAPFVVSHLENTSDSTVEINKFNESMEEPRTAYIMGKDDEDNFEVQTASSDVESEIADESVLENHDIKENTSEDFPSTISTASTVSIEPPKFHLTLPFPPVSDVNSISPTYKLPPKSATTTDVDSDATKVAALTPSQHQDITVTSPVVSNMSNKPVPESQNDGNEIERNSILNLSTEQSESTETNLKNAVTSFQQPIESIPVNHKEIEKSQISAVINTSKVNMEPVPSDTSSNLQPHADKPPAPASEVQVLQEDSIALAPAKPSSDDQLLPSGTLSAVETTELRRKFAMHDKNGDRTMDSEELDRCLADLEFTYSGEFVEQLLDVVIMKHRLHQSNRLDEAEFLKFMTVFYALHDRVVQAIEAQLVSRYNFSCTDELVAALCPFVSFTEDNTLDFSLMQSKLMEAMEGEQENEESKDKTSKPTQEEIQSASKMPENNIPQTFVPQPIKTTEDQKSQLTAPKSESETPYTLPSSYTKKLYARSALPPPSTIIPSTPFPTFNKTEPPSTISAVSTTATPSSTREIIADPSKSKNLPASPSVATQLAMEEDRYLHNCWLLLLQYFDPEKSGKLKRPHLVHMMRVMGIEMNYDRFWVICNGTDKDPCITEAQFKEFYNQLTDETFPSEISKSEVEEGLQPQNMQGTVTKFQFIYSIRKLCRNDIKPTQAERIFLLIGKDGSDTLPIDHVIQFIFHKQLTYQEYLANSPSTSTSQKLEEERINQQMVSKLLIRKMVRAKFPPPNEMIAVLSNVPASFRQSVLAKVEKRKELHLSNLMIPRLLPPINDAPDSTPSLTNKIGARNKSLQPSGCIIVELGECNGIPMPEDPNFGANVVSHRARICLMNKEQQISNVYTIKADRMTNLGDAWKFTNNPDSSNVPRNNRFVFRPNAECSTLIVELTCLMKLTQTKPCIQNQANVSMNSSSSEFLEMACGFVQIDLYTLLIPTFKTNKMVRTIIGGSFKSQTVNFDDTNKRNEASQPTLTLTVSEAMYTSNMTPSLFSSLKYLPYYAIIAPEVMEMHKLVNDSLFDTMGAHINELNSALQLKDLALSSYIKILNEYDLLLVLVEIWRFRLKRMDDHLNDKTSKLTADRIKSAFRALLMQVWLFLGCSTESFPSHIVDVTDGKRCGLFRACINANPLQVASHDGINLQSHVTQSTIRALQETQIYGYMDSTLYRNSPIEFENIFKPFDASEAFTSCNLQQTFSPKMNANNALYFT